MSIKCFYNNKYIISIFSFIVHVYKELIVHSYFVLGEKHVFFVFILSGFDRKQPQFISFNLDRISLG